MVNLVDTDDREKYLTASVKFILKRMKAVLKKAEGKDDLSVKMSWKNVEKCQ